MNKRYSKTIFCSGCHNNLSYAAFVMCRVLECHFLNIDNGSLGLERRKKIFHSVLEWRLTNSNTDPASTSPSLQALLHYAERLTNMSGSSVPSDLFSMPNDVSAAILDPHEPQSLTLVANNSLIKVFSDSR